ncbi:lycopene cyclase family protein [Wukongibacter sp. M2B1]|uniref:lycopene cyclase family protein n=1 Tax=Wukongibacter sp. M2B1 TaxID=3088895 RepID=UPI003D792748
MQKDILYDVIIVGGGPAGLSVGSELSKEIKVLVIEKEIAGETDKSWFIPLDVAEKNDDIMKYTYGGVKRYLASTYSGADLSWEVKQFARYPFIKEKELLSYWIDIIKNNNSQIINNCFYQNHTVKNGTVTVSTSKGNFKSKLLIDASGHNSVVLKNYEMEQDYYWWTIYGCTAKYKERPDHIKIGDYMLWQTFEDTNIDKNASLREGRPVFEYMVLDEETYLFFMLYLNREKMPMDLAEEVFMHMLREEESTKFFHDVEIIEPRFGYYPSGDLPERRAKDNVDFIGDAGCWTTPCGWGMSFILTNYKDYADNIIQLVKENKLDEKSLNDIIKLDVHQRHQILFDKLITHFLSNGSAEDLDKFINFFNIIDPLICEKVFTLRVTHEEIEELLKNFLKYFKLGELIKIIPKEDYLTVIKEIKYLLADLIFEKIFPYHSEDESGYDYYDEVIDEIS